MTTEKKREYDRQRYQENREKLLEHAKKYQQENKEKHEGYHRQYYQKTKEKLLEHAKKYYQENKEHVKKYQQENQKIISEKRMVLRQIKLNKKSFCECCGYIEKIMGVNHSHHIIPKSIDGADNKENRITLCPTCHEIAHKLVRVIGNRDKTKIKQQTNPQHLTRQGLIDGIKEYL